VDDHVRNGDGKHGRIERVRKPQRLDSRRFRSRRAIGCEQDGFHGASFVANDVALDRSA
jgi:hypothetical protein